MNAVKHIVLASVLLPTALFAGEGLNLQDCIDIGIGNNLQLRNAGIGAEAAGMDAEGALGIYDSRFSASYMHRNAGIAEPGAIISGDQETHQAVASLTKMLSTGTMIGLSASATSYEATFPDIGVAGEGFDLHPYTSKIELSLSQPLLKNGFGGPTRAVIELTQMSADIAVKSYAREEQLLRLAIAQAYWSLYASSSRRDVAEESLELAITLNESNRKKHKDNLIDESDLLSTEAVVETRRAEFTRFRNMHLNARDSLAKLIRLPERDWSDLRFAYADKGSLPTGADTDLEDPEGLFGEALRQRPDIMAMKLRVEQSGLQVTVRDDDLSPDLSLFGSIARGASEDDFGDTTDLDDSTWSVGIKFETPLGRSKEKSEKRKAQLLENSAVNDFEALTDVVKQECRGASRKLVSSRATLTANSKAKVLLSRKLKLEEKKYEQGRSDIRWVIQTQEDLFRARMGYHTAYAEYEIAKAACRTAKGVSIEGGAK